MAERPEVVRAKPLENPRAKVDWPYIVEQARAAGGEWVQVGPFSSAVAWRIRRGDNPYVNPDEFDITSRRDPESEVRRFLLFLRARPKL